VSEPHATKSPRSTIPDTSTSLHFVIPAIKVEKKAGEQIVYNKMKVKELKTLLGATYHYSASVSTHERVLSLADCRRIVLDLL